MTMKRVTVVRRTTGLPLLAKTKKKVWTATRGRGNAGCTTDDGGGTGNQGGDGGRKADRNNNNNNGDDIGRAE